MQGAAPVNIGDARMDRKFWREFDIANKKYVSSAVDPRNKPPARIDPPAKKANAA